MRILTWNVQKLSIGSSDEKMKLFNDWIYYFDRGLSVDMIFLCEVPRNAADIVSYLRRTYRNYEAYYIEVQLPNNYIFMIRENSQITYEGYHRRPNQTRGLALLQHNRITLGFTHALSGGGPSTVVQIVDYINVLAGISHQTSGNWCLGGDLNISPSSLNSRLTHPVRVFVPVSSTHSRGNTLDYFIYGLNSRSSIINVEQGSLYRMVDYYKSVYSWDIDHLPVYAQLDLR